MNAFTPHANEIRRSNKNLPGSVKVGRDVLMIPPVRLYGTAKVEEGCTIGKYTYVGNMSALANVDIGNYCSIARAVEIGAKPHPLRMLSSHPFQFDDKHFNGRPGYDLERVVWQESSEPPRVMIGNDVWLGAKVTIQGGVSIGTGAVVGSNAVVTKDVPPYAIVAGVPARIMRYRFDPDTIERLLASQWWHFDPADMSGIDFTDVYAALAEVERRRTLFETQVRSALAGSLLNAADRTNQGILWFDVEKSYAVPDVIASYGTVHIEASQQEGIGTGSYPILKSWFDPVSNYFAVWTGQYMGPVAGGSVSFRLE
jgi:acetyltransferase-like isoleucine patch superfamily enzyme